MERNNGMLHMSYDKRYNESIRNNYIRIPFESWHDGITGIEPSYSGESIMENRTQEWQEWLKGLTGKTPTEWDQLPDIGLYMDQVMTYIDRQLKLFLRTDSAQEHFLTAAMINNYIKDGLLPRAEKKKYAPDHLALLTMIGALKQVLSMQDLQSLLGNLSGADPVHLLYDRFLDGQNREVEQIVEKVDGQVTALLSEEPSEAVIEQQLRDLSLQLAIEARIRILVSEQLLNLLSLMRQDTEREKAETQAKSRSKGKSRKGSGEAE